MYIKTIKRDRERKHFKIQYSKKKITRETLVLGVEWPGFRALVSNSVHVVCITVRTGISQKNR